jgi:hypothetical protein
MHQVIKFKKHAGVETAEIPTLAIEFKKHGSVFLREIYLSGGGYCLSLEPLSQKTHSDINKFIVFRVHIVHQGL